MRGNRDWMMVDRWKERMMCKAVRCRVCSTDAFTAYVDYQLLIVCMVACRPEPDVFTHSYRYTVYVYYTLFTYQRPSSASLHHPSSFSLISHRPVVKGGGHRVPCPLPPTGFVPPSQFLQIMKNGSVHCASGRTRCTPMQTAFPSVYQFFAAAATFGASIVQHVKRHSPHLPAS